MDSIKGQTVYVLVEVILDHWDYENSYETCCYASKEDAKQDLIDRSKSTLNDLKDKDIEVGFQELDYEHGAADIQDDHFTWHWEVQKRPID